MIVRRQEVSTRGRELCTERPSAVMFDMLWRFLGFYRCLGCNKFSYTLCNTCMRQLTLAVPTCCRCSKFSHDSSVHGACQPHSHYFSKTIALFSYTKVVKRLFAFYKFRRNYQYQHVIEMLISLYFKFDPFHLLRQNFKQEDRIALIPVPMHPKKESDRGFSPAYEITLLLYREFLQNLCMTIEIFEHTISKVTDSTAQSKKKHRNRMLSLQRSIQILPKNVPEVSKLLAFKPTKLVIVDDVLTTGATSTIVIEKLAECLPELVEKTEVLLITFARSDKSVFY